MKQISGTEGDGNRVPSGDFSRELAEAGRMMRELRTRNFGKHLRDAEAERREAQQCKNPAKCLHPVCSGWFDIQGAEYTVPGWGVGHHFSLLLLVEHHVVQMGSPSRLLRGCGIELLFLQKYLLHYS